MQYHQRGINSIEDVVAQRQIKTHREHRVKSSQEVIFGHFMRQRSSHGGSSLFSEQHQLDAVTPSVLSQVNLNKRLKHQNVREFEKAHDQMMRVIHRQSVEFEKGRVTLVQPKLPSDLSKHRRVVLSPEQAISVSKPADMVISDQSPIAKIDVTSRQGSLVEISESSHPLK